MFNSSFVFCKLYKFRMRIFVIIFSLAVLFLSDMIVDNLILKYFLIEYKLTTFLSIVYILNTGISFSLLHDMNIFLLVIISFCSYIISSYLVINMYHKQISKKALLILTLLFFGSFSNIIDRIYYKGVIDYIYLHYSEWYFPLFNLSDCAISLAIILLLKDILIKPHIR